MPFRISKESKKWFENIHGKKSNGIKIGFDIDFDILYYCFIAGISMRNKSDLAHSETNETVEYFPGRFKEKGKLLVALFLSAELNELGVDMKQRDLVNEEISKLVSPNTQSYLSDLGMREFNKYVYGGFNVLLDWFDDRPRSLETFLLNFKNELDKALNSS